MKHNIICFLTGHILKSGEFPASLDGFYYHIKCIRCNSLFGLPQMTEEHIKNNYPIPLKVKQ